MKYMCMIFADEAAGAHLTDQDQTNLIAEMMAFNKTLMSGSNYAGGDALQANEKAMTVSVRASKVTITDGPFIETKDQFTGYIMISARDMDQAIQLASKIPAARYGHVEVRPVRDFQSEHAPADDAKPGKMHLETPRFVNADAMLFAGLHRRFGADQMHQIPELWGNFVPYMGTTPARVGITDYGLIFGNMELPGGLDYVAGLQVSTFEGLPPELMQITVPAQRYVVFPHPHHVSRMSETIGAIFESWFPTALHKPRASLSNLPATIEVYTPDFNPATGMGGLEVWVPIKN